MSMIGNYLMTDGENIRKLQSGELSASDFLYGAGWQADRAQQLDIDKAWHAIHFTLTGELYDCDPADPFSKVVLGGKLVNDEDIGYGPATFFTPDEVRTAYRAIAPLNETDFRARFDLAAMKENDIYPVMDDEDEEPFFGYIWHYFQAVQKFYKQAGECGAYILFYIN